MRTSDSHWRESGATNPYRPFPDKPYFRAVLDEIQREPVLFIEKSRDMMIAGNGDCVLKLLTHEEAALSQTAGRPFLLAKKCAVKGAGLQRVQLPPGNWFVPPGSNRDGSRGNEAVGALDGKGR